RRALVVVRIDEDAQTVRRRNGVATREVADDLDGLGVERAHFHVERRRVVEDAEFGPLARLAAFSRIALQERIDRGGSLTDRFADFARYADRGRRCIDGDGFHTIRRHGYGSGERERE